MEVPRLGVKSELHLLAHTTATATRDPSFVCNLYHSSWQCGILYSLSKARDWTHVLMDTVGFVTTEPRGETHPPPYFNNCLCFFFFFFFHLLSFLICVVITSHFQTLPELLISSWCAQRFTVIKISISSFFKSFNHLPQAG